MFYYRITWRTRSPNPAKSIEHREFLMASDLGSHVAYLAIQSRTEAVTVEPINQAVYIAATWGD